MSSVYEHINNYLNYLKEQHSLLVTIHTGDNRAAALRKYAEYNLHTNPYCLYVKTKPDIWDCCVRSQKKVFIQCEKVGSFCGVCHAGVLEYVYPIITTGKVVGFICVSGYRPKPESEFFEKSEHKLDVLCRNFRLDRDEVKEVYESRLSTDIPDKKCIDALIEPLCDMIRLDCLESECRLYGGSGTSSDDILYYNICNIIRRNHDSRLTLSYICSLTNYGKSHISHLFKKRSGMTINQYANSLRIAEAKTLLDSTDMSVQEVAITVGFSDSNYFSNVFKDHTGISPSEYRRIGKGAK